MCVKVLPEPNVVLNYRIGAGTASNRYGNRQFLRARSVSVYFRRMIKDESGWRSSAHYALGLPVIEIWNSGLFDRRLTVTSTTPSIYTVDRSSYSFIIMKKERKERDRKEKDFFPFSFRYTFILKIVHYEKQLTNRKDEFILDK